MDMLAPTCAMSKAVRLLLVSAVAILCSGIDLAAGAEPLFLEIQEYRIHLDDLLEIKVFNRPELWCTQEVRTDGMISLPLIKEIRAVSKTPSELDRVLTEKYSRYLSSPEVTVIVRKFNLDRVYVGGEVVKPGEIRFSGPLTLVQALFAAGGFRESASLSKCVIVHNIGLASESREVTNVKKILKNKSPDPLLKPFDVIVVVESRISKVNRYVDQYINQVVPDFFRIQLLKLDYLNEKKDPIRSQILQ